MKNLLCLSIFLLSYNLSAQDSRIPQSFLDDLTYEVGTWIGDNSKYKNDQEPFDNYIIEWTWGIGKKSIKGKLYGMIDTVATDPFWELLKYWDFNEKSAIVMQFGPDGTIGIGPMNSVRENEYKLIQTFTSSAGTKYTIGHKTVNIDQNTHEGSSYYINANEEWILDRSYIWRRK